MDSFTSKLKAEAMARLASLKPAAAGTGAFEPATVTSAKKGNEKKKDGQDKKKGLSEADWETIRNVSGPYN